MKKNQNKTFSFNKKKKKRKKNDNEQVDGKRYEGIKIIYGIFKVIF